MLNKLTIYPAALLLTACASVHNGNTGKSTAQKELIPLKISAHSIDGKKSDGLQLIEITLENTSGDWLKFEKAKLVIDETSENKISAVLGSDLKSWAQAAAARQKVEEHNKSMIQGGLILAGTVASMASGSKNGANIAKAGTAVVVGTYAWVVSDAIKASIDEAERSEKIPENHVYNSAAIAPKMYLRRWILLNKPVGQMLNNLVLEFETVEGEKESYAIKI
jgi:hypothetical protein